MDFLAGWVYMSGLPCNRRFFPRCAMGLPSMWPLMCGCHDVASHLAIATALQVQPCSGGIKTGKIWDFKNRGFWPFLTIMELVWIRLHDVKITRQQQINSHSARITKTTVNTVPTTMIIEFILWRCRTIICL